MTTAKKPLQECRILFIGNIANNAYNNAKILREQGIRADVLCYDYYHIMGCPEWEDADLEKIPIDQFFPRWTFSKENTFERPEWFFQGPMVPCLDALHERNATGILGIITRMRLDFGRKVFSNQITFLLAKNLYKNLLFLKSTLLSFPRNVAKVFVGAISLLVVIIILPIFLLIISVSNSDLMTARSMLSFGKERYRVISKYFRTAFILFKSRISGRNGIWNRETPFQLRIDKLVEFANLHVDNQHKITRDDLLHYESVIERWRRVLIDYDYVVGYSTDGIYPLLCDKDYIAYEHGTIRDIPWNNTVQGALCNLVYRMANHVLVTNCDNNRAADILCPGRYTFIPHPINEWVPPAEDVLNLRHQLLGDDTDGIVIFAPARHDWNADNRDIGWEKANDLLIRAAADLIANSAASILLVFVAIGRHVAKSRALIDELGITENVKWIEPVPHRTLMKYLAASDLVADQFFVATIGGIPGKAWVSGRPVINAYDRSIHEWCFHQDHPPIVECDGSFESIRDALQIAKYPDKLRSMGEQGREWFYRNHSSKVIFDRFSEVFDHVA